MDGAAVGNVQVGPRRGGEIDVTVCGQYGGKVAAAGHKVNVADTFSVDTRAPSGKTGEWTLDPDNLTVAATGTGKTLAFLIPIMEKLLERSTPGIAALVLGPTREHVNRVRMVEDATWLDYDTICTETTWEAARLAAGTAIEAALRGGFALVRPPGHHALHGLVAAGRRGAVARPPRRPAPRRVGRGAAGLAAFSKRARWVGRFPSFWFRKPRFTLPV